MKIGILFISFFIQITAAPRPYFLLIFPKVIPADGATKTCIHLSYLNESLSLTLTLQTKKNTIKLLQEFVVDTDWHRCISLQDTIQNIDIAEEANLNLTGGSDSYRFEKIKKIYLEKKKKNGTFIQTDKPVYKPGQTVKFRTVTLNEHFIPDLSQIPLVIIQDPQKNRISQWLNVTTQHGIGDFSFPLANEPLQGEYTIQIHKAGSLTYHSFTVEEYVLPKHEVQLKLPRAISVMDKEFTVTMCARYTYGKPVLGTAVFRICRKSQYFWQKVNSHEMTNDYCKEFNGTTDISGCVSKVIYTNYFHLRTPVFTMEFIVEAKLIEKDTDQELTASGKISISTQISKVTFEDVQDNYKTGIPFTGKVCVEGADGSPLSGVNVIIQSRQDLSEILSTNERGQAYFSLNTSAWNNQVISLSAYQEGVPRNRQTLFGKIEPYSEAASLTVSPQFSKSKSFLRIQSSMTSIVQCDKDFEIHVDYIFNRKALEGSPGNMVFLYLVMEGRRIVLDGQKQSNIGPSGSLKGTLSITVSLGADAAPKAKVLVYVILPNGELIADNREFTVSKCFRNKVKLQFMEPEVSPATETSLHLNAAAGSLCALRVVDKSVLLLKPEQELSIDKVYSTAKQEVADVYALQKEPPICRPPNPQAVANRTYTQIPPSVSNEMDVYRIIWDMGLDVSTDTSMRKPIFCSLKFTDTVSEMYDIPYMWNSHAFPEAAAVRVMKQQANADRLIGLRHQTG
ncbi:alpha-2-macroglobulin-like [Protopterus annectens]|uniref:alpha-2-macroglobulin-like n=1 Tax=Protopterus annectens TaxID=7888 RepID=UPI001CFB041B|nr:alpha-2-macroglobulin-like [Protopterus annectens]